MATGASHVAAGDLSTRMPERGAAEILALTGAFNDMARSLEQGKRVLEVQNEELRQSERMKSQLVSIVSHELRNPLTSILGYTSLLLNREVDPNRARHYLEIIQQQGNRLSSLIDHFLDSESVETGQVEIDLQPLDLKPLLVAEANLVGDKSHKHVIEVAVGPDTLPVKGDRERLAQVFANLLGNAVKYSPGGGRRRGRGRGRRRNGVRVHVRDDGIGVPDEHQSRIFTKFFRGSARESGIAGTGLGLAVSREIIEAHGGRISFTSAAGAGSHFWFELPLDVEAPSAEPPPRDRRLEDDLSVTSRRTPPAGRTRCPSRAKEYGSRARGLRPRPLRGSPQRSRRTRRRRRRACASGRCSIRASCRSARRSMRSARCRPCRR